MSISQAGYVNKTAGISAGQVNALLLKSPDMFIRKYEYIGTGVASASSSSGVTFTPATSPAWTVDELISGVANVYFKDDDGDACQGIVTDNTATDVDIESIEKIKNGAAPSLTDTTTYNIQILTPHATYAFGNYMGVITAGTYEPTLEKAQAKYDIPRKLLREDVLESGGKLTFTVQTIEKYLRAAVLGLKQFGEETLYYKFAGGSNPDLSGRYQITAVSQNVAGKNLITIFNMGQLSSDGSQDMFNEEYKTFGGALNLIANPIFADTYDLLMYWEEK